MLNILLQLALLASQPERTLDCESPSTPDRDACARVAFERADKELNTVYQRVIETLSTPPVDPTQTQYLDTKRLLVEAQRAWVKFREKDCDAVRNYWRDGPIQTSMYYECMLNRTEQRTKELDSLIEAY